MRASFVVALILAVAAPAAAQQPEELPPGHPPMGAPTEAAPPPAQPAPESDLPAGHPAPPGAPTAPPTAGQVPAPTGQVPAPTGQVPAPTGQAPAPTGQAPALPGHPVPPGAAQPAAPDGGGSQRRLQEVLQPPAAGVAEASSAVPVGSVRVTVVDGRGRAVPDVAVDIGALASGERTRYNERTNASGVATFSDLPTGGAQAYRVNVPNEGATFSTSPFQLPTDRGFEVRITRFEVTTDPRFVFFHVFRIIAEQRGERMHVIYQAELSNAGDEAFVFGEDYADIELPEEYVNFRFQRVITDQRVEEIEGANAYAIRGSIPPGTVRLAWAYELPIGESEMSIPAQIPLRFFGLQVLAEALPGLEMSVQGMPNAERRDTQGQACVDSTQTEGCAWVTMVRRGPGDPALRAITMRLTGIPGPSPVRWVAVAFALMFLLAGAFAFLVGPARAGPATVPNLKGRRKDLLAEAEELEEEFEAGEIGPEYRRTRKEQIVRDLAGVLHRLDYETGNLEGDEGSAESKPRGSLWFGLGVGLTLGLIGLIYIGLKRNDEPDTRRGVAVGFALQAFVGALVRSYFWFTN